MPLSPLNWTKNPLLHFDHQIIPASKDCEFDLAFPESIRNLSEVHWSPVNVCRLAAKLLASFPGTRVLDIGCGPGKFCVIGAATTAGCFTGIEQRPRLVRAAKELVLRHRVDRVEILQGNTTEMGFAEFDAFYLFNPFEENIFPSMRIDFDVELEPSLYSRYVEHVRQELSQKPEGTRVVTYCGNCDEIPGGYECQKLAFGDKLKLWVKTDSATSMRGAVSGFTRFDIPIVGRGSCGLVPA